MWYPYFSDNYSLASIRVLFHNICLISISNSVSDGATKKSVLDIEPNVLSTFFSRILKAKHVTKNAFCDPEILQFLKDSFYYKIYFTFNVAPEKLNKTNSNNSKQKNKIHHVQSFTSSSTAWMPSAHKLIF